jgi:acetyl-CoA carboxylase beta subunit
MQYPPIHSMAAIYCRHAAARSRHRFHTVLHRSNTAPQEHHHICFGCNYHLKMSSQERIDHLIDAGTWRPLDETLSPVDPLEFTDMKVWGTGMIIRYG